MISAQTFHCLLWIAATANVAITESDHAEIMGLNQLAVDAGLSYFGTATDVNEITDEAYRLILDDSNEFGMLTPGNSLKWDTVEPQQGVFDFSRGQQLVDLAEANGQQFRCHVLVWHQQLPSWLTGGTWTNETLVAVMKNHITKTVQYFGDACYAWDVVNEMFDDSGNYRESIFYKVIGPEYISIALQSAAEAAASTGVSPKLYLNDYNLVYDGLKGMAYRNLIADLQSRDIPIDGVGFQGHMIVKSMPSEDDLVRVFSTFTDLDVEIALTELDIRLKLPATEEQLEQQAKDYKTIVGACRKTTNCIGITIWDFTDRYSWVPSTFPGYGAALPWDDELVPKPAYQAIAAALSEKF